MRIKVALHLATFGAIIDGSVYDPVTAKSGLPNDCPRSRSVHHRALGSSHTRSPTQRATRNWREERGASARDVEAGSVFQTQGVWPKINTCHDATEQTHSPSKG